ncbi:hypothetical protein P9314_01240 [Paenibacillus validus]|uniref:Molybdopterin cofactor biosynthesis MoaD-related C-terminal domain-containing protein n=1 Tax=Paenibacillus validus TaxID=44253 RepID=A0A7X2Z8D0_9BACL|nr:MULTISPECIES: hypothetical protein [Paenibacillus]MED4599337.1 hypothetical protein [Paenibacillus validus]MED4606351.1 hypothetical protein [Paenibacillus validus]MUG70127.1 hypothetical protein [Paenibacillus validus]
MAEQTLEFRGIRCEHLMNYFKELEAEQQTFAFPYVFHGPGWRADILREDQVRITSRFVVNAVFVRFEASSEQELQDVIAAYRRKTFRAGG